MPISGYFDQVFANAGDLTPVPDAVQSSGNVSYAQGYGPLYQTPVGSGGIDIERAKMNQIFNDITTAIQQYQQHGTPPFITSAMNNGTAYSYSQFDRALLGGVVYQSLVDGNTDTPPSSKWAVAALYSPAPVLEGRFQYTSTSTCTLIPINGNQVTFPSGAIAVLPGAGISTVNNNAYINGTAAQTLSANTTYYAYLWNNGTAYVIDWSTTGYTPDGNSGITIKSGDATRVLVGLAQMNGSGNFVQTSNTRSVRSWANDHGILLQGVFSANRSTSSTTPTEINAEIRCAGAFWAGEACFFAASVSASNSVAGGVGVALSYNGTTLAGAVGGISGTGGSGIPLSPNGGAYILSDGYDSFTLLGYVNPSGTATFYQGCTLTLQSSR